MAAPMSGSRAMRCQLDMTAIASDPHVGISQNLPHHLSVYTTLIGSQHRDIALTWQHILFICYAGYIKCYAYSIHMLFIYW